MLWRRRRLKWTLTSTQVGRNKIKVLMIESESGTLPSNSGLKSGFEAERIKRNVTASTA